MRWSVQRFVGYPWVCGLIISRVSKRRSSSSETRRLRPVRPVPRRALTPWAFQRRNQPLVACRVTPRRRAPQPEKALRRTVAPPRSAGLVLSHNPSECVHSVSCRNNIMPPSHVSIALRRSIASLQLYLYGPGRIELLHSAKVIHTSLLHSAGMVPIDLRKTSETSTRPNTRLYLRNSYLYDLRNSIEVILTVSTGSYDHNLWCSIWF